MDIFMDIKPRLPEGKQTVSYWNGDFPLVDLPIKNGDVPSFSH